MECISNITGLSEVVDKLFQVGGKIKIWRFTGELGAGKTTLITEICQHLEVKDYVKSPSFNIVHEYKTHTNSIVYHFDFYRINHIEEALDIGIEEYFDSGNLCLIEWPELIEEYLPKPSLYINIKHLEGNNRQYQFEVK